MSTRQHRILKSSMGVAFATLLSRLLGLVRVMLEAMVLGGGAFASAWQLAFMVPNLFRRLLGEGALGTALIPVITHTEARCGLMQVRRDLSVVFAALGVLLAAIVVIFSIGARLLVPFVTTEYSRMALHLLPLLMPYALFICLIGVIGAILNSRQVFFLPALGALLLNFFLIGGLAAGFLRHLEENTDSLWPLLEKLSLLVLCSGALQLALMLWLLYHKGVFPAFRGFSLRHSRVLGELWKLVLPGLIGGAALQVSFVVDRLLAAQLGPQAVPALTYTDRIIDLPIGIFALSLGSVLMANMSRAAAHNDITTMGEDLMFGLRQVYFACVPMAVFVVVFREPLMRLMFLRGNFTTTDLAAAGSVAMFYGAGIPIFCAQKVILPAFYARKEMKKPLYVSLLCITVNIILNLILMWPLRQGGIALATLLAALLNNSLLLWLLYREGLPYRPRVLAASFARALGAALPAAGVFYLYPTLRERLTLPIVGELFAFLIILGLFCLLYLVLCRLFGGREPGEMLQIFYSRHRGGNRETPVS